MPRNRRTPADTRIYVYTGENDQGEQVSPHANKEMTVGVDTSLDRMLKDDRNWKPKPRVGRPKGSSAARKPGEDNGGGD
jgi:hypothetical protein